MWDQTELWMTDLADLVIDKKERGSKTPYGDFLFSIK